MAKALLDTAILSEYLKGRDQTVASQLKKALAWLNQNEQITPIHADYLAAATIKATARKQGSILELPDCLIAAVAVRIQIPLVTGNTDDFRAIQKTGINLTMENWREAT
jgi:predicted nucleic acid-binding protein